MALQAAGQPVISVDTKKKELIGEYKNGGSDYRAAGCPDPVKVHDFVDKNLGKVAPYGIYDVATNTGWVSLGIDHDTAEFAVNAVRRWHQVVGLFAIQKPDRMLITADGGGSNGSRVRLWKLELQKLADETGLTFQVCHYPPGTSKWNKIEHRMFCHITQNWRGKPLVSRITVVDLIAATTTKAGLTVRCELDERSYAKGDTKSPMQRWPPSTSRATHGIRNGTTPSSLGRQIEAVILECRLSNRAQYAPGGRQMSTIKPLTLPDVRVGAARIGAMALGAMALGAFALGAVAIGRLAVGGLFIRKARLGSVEIDDLTVRRLRVLEPAPLTPPTHADN